MFIKNTIYYIDHLTTGTSDIMEDTYEIMQARVDQGQCPICLKFFGKREKRQCAVSHIRVSKDPTHVMWRARWWDKMFPHGRHAHHPRDADKLPQAIRDAVYSVFGAEIAESVLAPPFSRGPGGGGNVPLIEVDI